MQLPLDYEIGVDVEKVNGPIFNIVERFFSFEEKYISKCEPVKRNSTAYKIWTLKEAFIKSKGKGLSIPLESFDIFLLGKMIFLKCIELKSGYYISISINKEVCDLMNLDNTPKEVAVFDCN